MGAFKYLIKSLSPPSSQVLICSIVFFFPKSLAFGSSRVYRTLSALTCMIPATAFNGFRPDIQTTPTFLLVLQIRQDRNKSLGNLERGQNNAHKSHSFPSIMWEEPGTGQLSPDHAVQKGQYIGKENSLKFPLILTVVFPWLDNHLATSNP